MVPYKKNLPCFFFSFFVLICDMHSSSNAKENNALIRHVVCFKFKQDASSNQIEKVETEFGALKNKIPGILSLEWGLNNSPENLNKNSPTASSSVLSTKRPGKLICPIRIIKLL